MGRDVMEKLGVENLKKCTHLVEALCQTFAAAKEDDGKVTWSDLLDPDVWEHGFDVVKESGALADRWDDCLLEINDLSADEAMELVQHYFLAFKLMYHSFVLLKDKEEVEPEAEAES